MFFSVALFFVLRGYWIESKENWICERYEFHDILCMSDRGLKEMLTHTDESTAQIPLHHASHSRGL
jgi:hypothetical protein